MEKKNKIIIGIVILIIICGVAISYILANNNSNTNGNVNITDMVGRIVQIPSSVNKVIATSPSTTGVIYMLAPEKLAGIQNSWDENELKYIPNEYKDIPAVGGWYGSNTGNYEEFIKLNPDVVIESIKSNDASALQTVNERQSKMGSIPVVVVNDTNNVTNNDAVITFMGKLLNKENNAQDLINFNHKNLDKVKEVTDKISDKKTVYYAEGNNGLKTEGPTSQHTQLINICGGKNVVDTVSNESTQVSIEQVMNWNPDVIITTSSDFYNNVYNDSQWSNVKAVQNHEVYLAPDTPFNWFDRPVGINMIMGVPWTAKVLYPDEFKDLDLVDETKYFYKNFYHFDLNDQQAKQMLLDSGLKEQNL